ncbi:hypothetical protein [Methanobrevibacter olleyae]|nr:hypothetical protein [Methanobrevibacter olleyae]
MSFRQIRNYIVLSKEIKEFLNIEKAPNYSTLQKFFKRLPTNILNE